MVSGTSASLCRILLSVCFSVSASEGLLHITAKPGDTVPLRCQAPRNITVQVIKWIRPDLDNPTVCVYRDGKWEIIDPSFKGRVQLNHDWVKNGDVSLILKNVTINDTGTYECHVKLSESKRQKRDVHLRDSELIKTIVYLTVSNSGGGAGAKDGGNNHGLIGLGVVVLVLFVIGVVVGVFAFKRKGFIKVKSDEKPASKADDPQQI